MSKATGFSMQWIAQALPGTRISANAKAMHASVARLCSDSRSIQAGDAFVALRGERFDGHGFIGQAIEQGAGAIIAEQWPAVLDGAWARSLGHALPAVVLVADARRAYGHIAKAWRSEHALPVVAVTGSNGKTTVKEMLGAISRAHFGSEAVLVTRGNLNNDIGVPQMVLELQDKHRAAVLELGMNHPGEIAWLAAIAQPTVALITNAQREHQEFMGSVEATAIENAAAFEALPPQGVAVFPGDEQYTALWSGLAGRRETRRFGWAHSAEHASSMGLDVWAQADQDPFTLHVGDAPMQVQLQLLGQHNRRNALAAACAAAALGCSTQAIGIGLSSITPVKGRLVEAMWGDVRVIDDSYNANPDSVRAAIDVLAAHGASGKTILVLGDMGEVGERSAEFHAEVGAYAADQGVDQLLGLGHAMRTAVDAANRLSSKPRGTMAQWFDTTDALIEAIRANVGPGATVLVKGSRFMKMERIVQALLAQPQHRSEVSHAA